MSGYLVKILHIGTDVHHGWNGNTSILFLFLGLFTLLSLLPFGFIRPAVLFTSPEEELLGTPREGAVVVNFQSDRLVETKEARPSALAEIKGVFSLMVKPRMLLLLCFFFNDGYQQVFLTSQFTRQLVDLSSVGTLMALFSIADVLFAYLHGFLLDKFGHGCVLTLATLGEVGGLVLSWIANAKQDWTVYLTGLVFAIADGGFQTEVRVEGGWNVVFVARQPVLCEQSDACQFGVSNGECFSLPSCQVQCFGFAIALTLTPFFKSETEAHSSPTEYFWEVVIAGILGIGGYIGCMVFMAIERRSPYICLLQHSMQ